MRKVAILGVLMALQAIAGAQTGNTVIRTFAGAPTGSCSSVMVAVNGSSGNFFDCLSGAWHNVAAGGAGTVTSVSSGNLSPLFTVAVGTPTTTPAFTFAASTFAPHTFYGNNTAGTATPGAQAIGNADLPGSGSITLNATSPLGGGGSIALGGTLNFTCTGCLTSVTAHNLLSATHGDTTAGTVARGDVVTGQGASPTWARLAKGTANQILAMDGTGTDVVWSPAPAGTGTVTSIATSSPISGGTITTTGTISCPNCVDKTLSNTYSASTTQAFDQFSAKYWGAARFDASLFGVGDWCARNLNVLSDALYILASAAIIDSQRLTGSQTCALGSTVFSATKPTHWLLGQMTLSLPNSGVSFLDVNGVHASLAAPAAPTLATATTGGSLGATTAFGVKVAYCNLTGTTVGSAETTQLTGAGATNTITVTSPINSTSLQAYNIYSATPVGSGWKLNNTTGCIPLGTNYVIQTVGAGAVPLATGTAWEGLMEIEGQGDSTVISEDSVNSPFLISSNNVHIHHLKFVSSQTSNNNGSLWIDSSNDIEADHLTFAGGGNGIFVNVSNRVRASVIRCGKFTVSGSCVNGTNSTLVNVRDVSETDTVLPAGGNLQGVVNFDNCTGCSVDGWFAKNLDFSNIANAAAIIFQQGSSGIATNGFADGLINADGLAALVMSGPVHFSNATIQNTKVGTGAGVGTNSNNGDAVDIDDVSNVTIDNIHGINLGLVGGLRFPCYEFYNSNNIIATGITCTGSTGEGVNEFGCTGCKLNGVTMTGNGKSGLLVQDSTSTVSCTGGTTITFTSGFGFGPWPVGTPFTVNGVANTVGVMPTSTTTMTAAANCANGAGQAFLLITQDTQANGSQFDDNGTAAVGATSCSGIDILGSSGLAVNGGSANDNHPTATKKQCFGINASGVGASFSATNFDPSGNLGGTCANEIGPATAGNHWACDIAKLSALIFRKTNTPTWQISTSSAAGASLNVPTGVAPTSPANGDLWNDGTNYNIRLSAVTYAVGRIVGSGTAAMTTGAVAGGACGTTVTVAATGVATTDTITFARNVAVTSANGGLLALNAWPTSGNVNFNYCNGGTVSNTPTAMTLNWRVVR